MDSDDERMRDEEMSKLRSGSSSPSAISTASSGSPLVRGSSATKRPAPTSIAAAQLQCQQQQLEFTNRLMTGGGKKVNGKQQMATNKQSAMGAKSRQIDWPAMQSEEKMTSANAKLAAEKLAESKHEDNKSFGYNLAKSIAFRAYRFNEFWSVNKMRYMNLACLLMTLICLITILLFSSGNSSNNNNNIATVNRAIKHRFEPTISAKKIQPFGDEASETIESLESQPLIGSSSTAQQVSASSANENIFDDFNLVDDRKGAAKFRRKSEITSNEVNGAKSDATDREIEDSNGNTQLGADLSSDFDRQKGLSKVDQMSSDSPSSSLIDPILSQIFNDMEIGSLFKAIRRASNGTTNGKPVIRRSKNGATIIISSSSFNRSALNDSSSPFPSLIEKLLPPFLRPISLSGNPTKSSDGASSNGSSNQNPGALATGMATITIGSEPIFASSSNPMALSRLSPFFMDPFSSGYHSHQTSRVHSPNLFMEPVGFRSPFGPFFGPSPMAMPQPSLMSMIMRGANQIDSEDDGLSFSRSSVMPQSPIAILATDPQESKQATQNASLLNTSASQISNQTLAKPDSAKAISANDSEVETLDLSQLSRPNRMHNFYPRQRPAGSMLIFSSGGLSAARDPFQFPFGPSMSPFMAAMPPPPPQMMLVGGGNGAGAEGQGNGLLNPILRTILNNVMSDLTPSVEQTEKNKTERNQQARMRASSNIAPNWTALSGDLDEDWASGSEGDRWDEHSQSKQMRARHRETDEMDPNADASEFVNGIQLDQAPSSPLASVLDRQLESGVVSGTIRQTIRGPGMTVERIIEVPSSRVQQVAPGIRSQSLSRADFEDTSESTLSRPIIPTGSIFSRQTNDRMSSDDSFTPHVGFIGKLLSDISRRSEQSNGFRNGPPMIRNRSIDEDLDEGDSGEIMAQPRSPSTWPKIRVASARIHMRPLSEIRSSPDSLFMPPSHFSVPESGDIRESEKESGNTESKIGSTFEDTMNSMEDRLNHVLSMASHQTLSSNHKPNNDDAPAEVTVNKSGSGVGNQVPVAALARGNPMSISNSNTALQPEIKQTPTSIDSQQKQNQAENPFTSPTSPLFGFPTSSMAQTSSDSSKNKSTGSSNNNANSSTNRQQRSFTYHSNNEIATPHSFQIGAGASKQQDQLVSLDSVSRSRFIPLSSPPASIVMGRRLDDGPFQEANNNHAPDHFQSATRSNLGRAFSPNNNQAVPNEQNYRTIVV